ncbi:MAG: asparaginase [Candidatus Daviesbacteria bacterium]|nr:asparaginase [Candidatus Daviesbacteria bacterium]
MKTKKDLIHFITMGGTIDASWNGLEDAIVVSSESNIPAYFARFPLLDEVMFTQVCAKDSRAVTEEDLKKLLKTIEESQAKRIVITHGTFTMPDTARFLRKKLIRKDQTIVLTGATTPIKGFEMTDAPLNLGYAISQVQYLKPNVYISMKGKTFTSEKLDEDLKAGKFHQIFSSEEK